MDLHLHIQYHHHHLACWGADLANFPGGIDNFNIKMMKPDPFTYSAWLGKGTEGKGSTEKGATSMMTTMMMIIIFNIIIIIIILHAIVDPARYRPPWAAWQ